MSDWTDWVEHDGSGFPARIKAGMIIEVEVLIPWDNMRFWGRHVGFITPEDIIVFQQYSWSLPCPKPWGYISKYRIQKPKALAQLIEQIRDIDLPDENEQIKDLEKIASFANSEGASPF